MTRIADEGHVAMCPYNETYPYGGCRMWDGSWGGACDGQ